MVGRGGSCTAVMGAVWKDLRVLHSGELTSLEGDRKIEDRDIAGESLRGGLLEGEGGRDESYRGMDI